MTSMFLYLHAQITFSKDDVLILHAFLFIREFICVCMFVCMCILVCIYIFPGPLKNDRRGFRGTLSTH
jgi:hypothetical protein